MIILVLELDEIVAVTSETGFGGFAREIAARRFVVAAFRKPDVPDEGTAGW